MLRSGLAGLAFAGSAGTSFRAFLRAAGADEEEVLPFTDIPENFSTERASKEPEANPGQNTFRMDLRNLKSWVTPTPELFAVQHYNVPRVDSASFKLAVEGLVSKPMSLSLDDLRRRPPVRKISFFECSGNQARGLHGMVGNARYTGTSLKDVLREAGPTVDAKEVIFWAADSGKETIRAAEYQQNFARSMTLEDALNADALLVYAMNGEPLPVVHGFPLRLVVPGWYGIANVKWLTRIELASSRLMNRFMGRDYVTVMGRQVGDRVEYVETSVTRMRVKSVIARLTRSQAMGGRIKVFGAAWSDGTPLKSVEVQIDDGAWQPAKLEAQDDPHAWTFFTLEVLALSPGAHTAASRATDRRGRTQPESLELKKTYWEDNAHFRRTVMVS